jgi:hypothetical protein
MDEQQESRTRMYIDRGRIDSGLPLHHYEMDKKAVEQRERDRGHMHHIRNGLKVIVIILHQS